MTVLPCVSGEAAILEGMLPAREGLTTSTGQTGTSWVGKTVRASFASVFQVVCAAPRNESGGGAIPQIASNGYIWY